MNGAAAPPDSRSPEQRPPDHRPPDHRPPDHRPADHREVEQVAREHAGRVAAGDARARDALAVEVALTPPDLLDRLLDSRPDAFEMVAHARIGNHHILKTRYVGRETIVVQCRWVRDAAGSWRIVEGELARVAPAAEP